MVGVILETISNKKLIGFAVALFLLQAGFFLIGGLKSPAPYNVQSMTSYICLDDEKSDPNRWLYSRKVLDNDTICNGGMKLTDIEKLGVTNADRIVFTFQFPFMRDGRVHKMSRVHQNFVSVVQASVGYSEDLVHGINSIMTLDIRLGGRNTGDSEWKEIARGQEQRPFRCSPAQYNVSGYDLDCDQMALFELGSISYEFYLLNIRLPASNPNYSVNTNIGKPYELSVVAIHPNGGFTIVWFSVKTVVFPFIAGVLAWYVWRISRLQRKSNVLEQTLMALGSALTLLNFPVDWLTLWINMPFMVLYSDIRQGLFYSVLLCFWIVFAGEHMMDQVERSHVSYYWKHLSAVGFGCICMFVFEMCERGVQLTNPFYSIWATTTGQNLGLTFIILAGLSAGIYFLYLLSMVVGVFRNIMAKKSALPAMSKPRRKFYMGLIYRFSFLMAFTLVCAAMTVILYIIGEVSEGYWKWSDEKERLVYTSAVQTGVYGMWNIYVFSLLVLYAPSNKYVAVASGDAHSKEETVEFSTIPSEASVLTAFAQKSAED